MSDEPSLSVPAMTLLLLVVALLCAAVLYLDWRTRGELDLLHERIDRLNLDGGRLRVVREPAAAAQPRVTAPVSSPSPAAAPPSGPTAAQFTGHEAPAGAPERAAALPPEVIVDPLPGLETGGGEPPAADGVHPLIASVLAAHTSIPGEEGG